MRRCRGKEHPPAQGRFSPFPGIPTETTEEAEGWRGVEPLDCETLPVNCCIVQNLREPKGARKCGQWRRALREPWTVAFPPQEWNNFSILTSGAASLVNSSLVSACPYVDQTILSIPLYLPENSDPFKSRGFLIS